MTDRENLERQLAQCRRLSLSLTDTAIVDRLTEFAAELEARIRDLGAARERDAQGSPES